MWRKLLNPITLFTVATLQALSPYFLWQVGISSFQSPNQDLTYTPIVLWVLGWIGFVLGALAARSRVTRNPRQYPLASSRVCNSTALAIMFVVLAEAYLAIRVYGIVPILSYLRHDNAITVSKAVALQSTSFVGQFAFLRLSMYLLCAAVPVLLIRGVQTSRPNTRVIGLCLITMVSAASLNGKRGDVVRILITLFSAIALATNDPFAVISRVLPLNRSRLAARLAVATVTTALVASFGYLGEIRNQQSTRQTSLNEILRYQEYPLVNMEAQCRQVGLGPYQFNLLFPFLRLFPYRLISTGEMEAYQPPRVVPSSPSGIFENVQWTLGPIGVLVYALIIGMVTTILFNQSGRSLFCLLGYCQCITSLLFVHTVDEFSILLYVPAPLMALYMLTRVLKRNAPQRNRPRQMQTHNSRLRMVA